MELVILVFFVALFCLMYGLFVFMARIPGKYLRRKFIKLGKLQGRKIDEITLEVGPAHAVFQEENGQTLYQWISEGYHIALRCRANICESYDLIVDE